MTYDALSTVEIAGTVLAHDVPRNGDASAPWTFDTCYPACGDCNGEDSNRDASRGRVVIVPDALALLTSGDYRVSGPVADSVIARNRAMTDARKARKRAARRAAGTM
jgi:hypothetical protein